MCMYASAYAVYIDTDKVDICNIDTDIDAYNIATVYTNISNSYS